MPYDSLEVRWFFDGALAEVAPEVETWFKTTTPQGIAGTGLAIGWPATWRGDRYARLPRADDMGIKLREGRLEIKGRVSAFGVQSFLDRVQGFTERWMKWSHDVETESMIAGEDWPSAGLADAGGFVMVEKLRMLRRLDLDRGSLVEIPAGRAAAGTAVHLELTRIRLAGSSTERHWSIAFEAYPYDAEIHALLARVVSAFLKTWPLGSLSAERSRSYPAWLSQRL